MAVAGVLRPGAEPQTLAEIRDLHRGVWSALVDQHASMVRAVGATFGVLPNFIGMSAGEVEAHYDAQKRELDWLTMLNLVACSEAAVRADYFRRIGGTSADALSVAYKAWHATLPAAKQARPNFDDGGILDQLDGAHVVGDGVIVPYRRCLLLRHWVAHGRYWGKPVGSDQLDPDEVYTCCDVLLRALPQ